MGNNAFFKSKKLYALILVIAVFILNTQSVFAYRVGINYHATNADFSSSAFINKYHDPAVRAMVKSQLQQMADSGAKVVNTRIWFTDPTRSDFSVTSFQGFPLSAQEVANLRLYAQDVAAIKGSSGQSLDLYLTLLWLGCGNYRQDTPCHYSWNQYVQIAKTSIDQFFTAIGDIKRPDGQKAVRLAYFDGEVMIGAGTNTESMLTDVYPYFVQSARDHGIEPTLYFIIAGKASEVFDDNFIDPANPAINHHKSLYWVYRSTEFMRTHNLFIPPRIDLSFYPNYYPEDINRNVTDTINRVMADMQAVYPGKPVGIAETTYPQDPARRRQVGLGYAQSNVTRSIPEEVLFWTTPDSGGAGVNAGFPFDIASFYLTPPVPAINVHGDVNGDSKDDLVQYRSDGVYVSLSTGSGFTSANKWSTDFNDAYGWASTDFVRTLGDVNGDGKADLVGFGVDGVYIGLSTGSMFSPTAKWSSDFDSSHGWVDHHREVRDINEDGKADLVGDGDDGMYVALSTGSKFSPIGKWVAIKPGDLNADSKVDVSDYTIFATDYGKTGPAGFIPSDINKDGKVNIFDYTIFVGNYGK